VYGLNDIYDYETDIRNEKKRGYERVLAADRRITLAAAIGCVVAPFGLLALATRAAAFWSLALFLLIGWQYSSPPVRAKAVPFLDAWSNVFYVLPALVGFFVAGGESLSWTAVGAGAAWCVAMHAFSALPDIDADQSAGIATTATVLRERGTALYCAFWYGVAAYLGYEALGTVALSLGLGYVCLMLAMAFDGTQKGAFALYRWFPLINMFAGGVLTVLLILERVAL